MKSVARWLIVRHIACGLLFGVLPLNTFAQVDPAMMRGAVQHLYAITHKDSSLWERTALFCDTYPKRLSGTPVLEKGIEWLVTTFMSEGWDVKTQEVMVPHWQRGDERLLLLGDNPREMRMLGLGGSVGTDGEPLRANVLVVSSFEDLKNNASKAKGAIVLFNVPFTTYGETVKYRYGGASAAAEVGAVAALVRSVGPFGMQTPHTGGMGYKDGVDKIPTAAITMEDAMLLQRMQDRGLSAEVELVMNAQTLPDKKTHNVIIEIPGAELPNEVVVMGGHIDAWDVGTGAMDDASGCFVTWKALDAIRSMKRPPKRTIRAVFWTNEENGLRGGTAYADQTKDEKHILAMEVDGGTFRPRGFSGSVEGALKDDVTTLMTFTQRVGAAELEQGEGGADTSPLHEKGVPVLELVVDTTKYFWYHHTDADTPDKLDPLELNDCAFAMAVMAWGIANR